MSAIDEVKQKIDIVEVVSQYASLKKSGKNFSAPCPFHSEKHPSFFVYPEQQSWHCFGACSTGGDVISFVMKKESMSFGEALEMLATKAGVTLPSKIVQDDRKEEKEELYRISEAASLYFNNLLINATAADKARRYVENRGLSPQTVADFQIGFSLDSWEALKNHLKERSYSEDAMLNAGLLIKTENSQTYDRFRGKLMFPIRDIKGRTIGFGGRALDDSLPKYTNSPQTPAFDKSSTIYAIDRAAASIRKQDMAIIMEGYMDVITAHQNGVINAVASMGTSITETQVNILKRLSRNLVLSLDADAAGEEAMLRGIGYENSLNAEVKVIVLPKGSDPDDVIKEDVEKWRSLVDKAVPIVDYTFNMVASRLDLTTARDKSLAVEKLSPIVAEIKDPVRQAHYVQKLAALVNVGVSTIEAVMCRIKPPFIRRRTPEVKPSVARSMHPFISSPREEYCLALLLQHPKLKDRLEDLSPEYFESSENREIFLAWLEVSDVPSLRDRLDPSIHEHFDTIAGKELPATRNNTEQKYTDCVIELRKRYLKSLAAKKAQSGDSSVDPALLEEDLKISSQLRELDARKSRKHTSARR